MDLRAQRKHDGPRSDVPKYQMQSRAPPNSTSEDGGVLSADYD